MTTHSRSRVSRVPTQRRRAARQQRERRRQRGLLVFAAIVLIAVVAIPAYGYYDAFIAPPRQVIREVNGVKHTLGDLAQLTRANVAAELAGGGQPSIGILPIQLWQNMLNEELIRQAAPREGLSVTQDEIEAEIRNRYYPEIPEGGPTDPEALEREFQENYRNYLNITQFSESQHRGIIRDFLFRRQIRDKLKDQVPAVEEQVFVHWFRIENDAQLDELQTRLENGEAFDRLARIFGQDDKFADDNGVVGWVPRGAFPDLEETLFSIEHDTAIQAGTGTGGELLLKVTDGPEVGDISDEMREELASRALEQWLQAEAENAQVTGALSSKEYEWVAAKAQEIIPRQN